MSVIFLAHRHPKSEIILIIDKAWLREAEGFGGKVGKIP